MKTYGLIGYRLSHSFSKKYFGEKFSRENITDCVYENFPLDTIAEFLDLLKTTNNPKGFNVTIPYKEEIMPFLSELDASAKVIGAVNVVKVMPDGKLIGYNSDYYGFKYSLEKFIPTITNRKALVLGTGGAAKAVVAALKDLGIAHQYVSRTKSENTWSYADLNKNVLMEYTIIINNNSVFSKPIYRKKYFGISTQQRNFTVCISAIWAIFIRK